jgi:hypothetical protein
MVRPRRAYKRWWWPQWLRTTAILLWVALIGFSILYAAQYPERTAPATETVIPQPGPTWTAYVPEMPWACHDMLAAADAIYDLSTASEQATIRAAELATQGASERSPAKLIEAGRAIEEAERYGPKMKAARANFLKQYERCRKA